MIEEPHGNYRCECDDCLQKHMANKDISGVMPGLEVCGGIKDYKYKHWDTNRMTMGWKGSWCWALPSTQLPSPSAPSPLLSSTGQQCQHHVIFCCLLQTEKQTGLRNNTLLVFFGWFILNGLPTWPMWVLHKQLCWQWWQRSTRWYGQSLCGPLLQAHTCMHIWISITRWRKVSCTVVWESSSVLKDGDEHAGAASMPSPLLVVHELLWALCSPSWKHNLLWTEEQSKQHHRFPRRFMANLCMSDKQICIHNFSSWLFSVSARKQASKKWL